MNTVWTNDQWMPVLAVKQDGTRLFTAPAITAKRDGTRLFIAWYDRRNAWTNNSLIQTNWFMRAALLSFALLIVLQAGFERVLGQGTFIFSNYIPSAGLDAPVSDANGDRLEGGNYMAMLYGTATEDSLQPIVPAVSFLTGSNAGYFGGGVRAVNGVGPGAPAWVQVRAWDSRLGNSYEQVIALGIGGYGESILLHINSGGTLQGLPAPLLGLQSFSLLAEVPEPNAVVLLLLGLPLLLLRKRRFK